MAWTIDNRNERIDRETEPEWPYPCDGCPVNKEYCTDYPCWRVELKEDEDDAERGR